MYNESYWEVIMLDSEIVSLLNKQLNKELFSAYFYFSISNYYAEEGLNGFENWYTIQAQEEFDHAKLIRGYLLNSGAAVTLSSIGQPNQSYSDFKAPLTSTYVHEQTITASINEIYTQTAAKKDYRTMQFLDWFVKEQGEEEKNISDIIKRFELFGSDPKSLYQLDAELSSRVYAAPTLAL